MQPSTSELQELRVRARASPDGEAYLPLLREQYVRAGLVARRGGRSVVLFLEVTLSTDAGDDSLDSEFRRLSAMRLLLQEGYVMTCEDLHSSTMERPVGRQGAMKAISRLLRITAEGSHQVP